jgi:drug/metabolite transporter (DMT)-like permease
MTRKLAGVEATETMQFYMGASGTVLLLPFAVANWHNPTSTLDWVLLFAVGFFGWAGHELLTRAHRFAPASTLMPFGYSFMIYLTIASYVIFNHPPEAATLWGALIIVAAGLFIWLRERTETAR